MMNRKPFGIAITVVLVLALLLLGASAIGKLSGAAAAQGPDTTAIALGSAFTYQGQLKLNSVPVNSTCTITFKLFDAQGSGSPPTGGTQVGSTLNLPVTIVDGLFTTQLDFGAVFQGSARWLEMTPDCGAGAITLSPRQPLTAAPYALFSAAPWVTNGSNLSYSGGNVGIGTANPAAPLEVITTANTGNAIEITTLGGAPTIYGRRANGTLAAPSGVQNGNTLAVFASKGYGTNAYGFFTAYMDFQATENWTNTAQGTRIRFFTPSNGSNSPQKRLEIDQNGNVGIGGPVDPISKLQVVANSQKDTAATTRALAVTTNDLFNPFSLDVKILGDPVLANRGVILQTTDWNFADGGNILLQPQGGNVGIGTTAPSRKLTVQTGSGDYGISTTDGTVSMSLGVAGVGAVGTTSDHDTVFVRNGINILTLGVIGGAGEFKPSADGTVHLGISTNRWIDVFAQNGTIQTSDARLKKSVTDLSYGLDQVMQLRPISFQWKAGKDEQTHLGLIAQEVEKVIPEVVERSQSPAAPLGMNYSGLVPVLIKAVQEQQAALNHNEAEIKALKADNEALNARLTAIEQTINSSKAVHPVSNVPATGWFLLGGLVVVGVVAVQKRRGGV